MLGFYDLHPQYAASPLYVAGESFAGKYIPFFASHVLAANRRGGRRAVPLAGVAIGNGVLKPLLQYGSLLDVAPAFGYADAADVRAAKAALGECAALLGAVQPDWTRAYDVCQAVEDSIYHGALPFIYDVRETRIGRFDSITGNMARYLNRADTRAALHVGEHVWVQMDGGQPGNAVSDALMRDQIVDLPAGMIERLIRALPGSVLFYAGNMDGSMCNALGVGRCLDTLRWEGAPAYRNASRCVWRDAGGSPAGMVQRGGGLTWLTVLNSGHLVPMYQPRAAVEMVKAWHGRRARWAPGWGPGPAVRGVSVC